MNPEKSLTRVLRYEDRCKSDIEYRQFNFSSEIFGTDDLGRPITVTLKEKTYSRNQNLNCYFEVDASDETLGRKKLILTTTPRRDYKPYRSYLDMRKVALGEKLCITLGKGKFGIVWLKAKTISPQQTA